MTSHKKLFLLVILACFSARLQAQIEVARLMTKGMSSTGHLSPSSWVIA